MKHAYLVTYDTGSYDTFCVHNVGICFTIEGAKELMKRTDKEHEIPKSMFESNPDTGENPRSFSAIQYAVDEYEQNHPEEFHDIDKIFDKPYYKLSDDEKREYKELIDKNNNHVNDLLVKFVMEQYPEWDEKTAKEAIELEEVIDYLSYEEYGSAKCEEIKIFD